MTKASKTQTRPRRARWEKPVERATKELGKLTLGDLEDLKRSPKVLARLADLKAGVERLLAYAAKESPKAGS